MILVVHLRLLVFKKQEKTVESASDNLEKQIDLLNLKHACFMNNKCKSWHTTFLVYLKNCLDDFRAEGHQHITISSCCTMGGWWHLWGRVYYCGSSVSTTVVFQKFDHRFSFSAHDKPQWCAFNWCSSVNPRMMRIAFEEN